LQAGRMARSFWRSMLRGYRKRRRLRLGQSSGLMGSGGGVCRVPASRHCLFAAHWQTPRRSPLSRKTWPKPKAPRFLVAAHMLRQNAPCHSPSLQSAPSPYHLGHLAIARGNFGAYAIR